MNDRRKKMYTVIENRDTSFSMRIICNLLLTFFHNCHYDKNKNRHLMKLTLMQTEKLVYFNFWFENNGIQ